MVGLLYLGGMGKLVSPKADPKNTLPDEPQKIFVGTMLGMSWQMAVAVLVPTILGIQADKHFDTDPYLTLTGLLLATIFSILIVRQAVKNLNTYMMADPPKANPKDTTNDKDYDDDDD
ncbi:MAG: hypothetical protein JWN38_202 [Candidatus Saccharibacteria bacterium]|nr:hypothetical protein [Candidatus Saccharibacteria bacterium]